MNIFNPVKVFWDNIKDAPDRISRLIELSAADGAIFLDADNNYKIVPFGSNAGEIAEGNHTHSILKNLRITSVSSATSETSGALTLPGIGMGNGNIYSTGTIGGINFTTRRATSFAGYNFWNNLSGGYRISLQRTANNIVAPLVNGSDVNMVFNISYGTQRGYLFAYNFNCLMQIEYDGNTTIAGNFYSEGSIHAKDGATGTFTDVKGNIITVIDGIITGID